MANMEEVREKIRLERISKLKKYEEQLKSRIAGFVVDKNDASAVELKAWLDRDMVRTKRRIAHLGG
jgi:hypothetical protein